VSDPQCGESQLFETLFGVEIPMPVHASRSFIVKRFEIQDSNYDVCADRHWPADGGIFYDAAEYADLCFYISLNCFWQGNITGSESWFRKAEAMWQGHGFFDKNAKRTNNYDNYKLGLYLYTARVTRFSSSIYASVESVAWSYQKREDGEGRGGITTLSSLDGEPFGTANIETTSALLLAYNEDLTARLHAQGMKAGATVALDTAASRLALIASPEDSSAKKYVADAKSRITGAENASEIGDYDSSYLQATEATGLLDKAIAAERAYQSFKFQMLLVGGLSVAAIAIVAGVVMRKRQQYHHLHHA
jgi:hypothetical protein